MDDLEGKSEAKRDRRRQHPVDVVRTQMYLDHVLKLWRGQPGATDAGARGFHIRSLSRYEQGKQVIRDRAGCVVDRTEGQLPGSAAMFRSPVWQILKGEPPDTRALIALSDRAARGPGDRIKGLRTFADLEAILIDLELARAEGRHIEFAQATEAVRLAIPGLCFIAEAELQAEAFLSLVQSRLEFWEAEVQRRRSRGLLGPDIAKAEVLSETNPLAPAVLQKGEPLADEWAALPPQIVTSEGGLGRRYVHLGLALLFLWIAWLAPPSFGQLAAVVMMVVNTILALPSKVVRFGVTQPAGVGC